MKDLSLVPMDGFARHHRSHSRAPPQHPSSTNGFPEYDNVLAGRPKLGPTSLAPPPEDYSEIFSTFLSTSIPMLDLPPVDQHAFQLASHDYSDVFRGGFQFADFAVPYDNLFEHDRAAPDSDDDAGTRAGTESLSEESDPSGCSDRNPYFLNKEFHQSLECNQLNISYHKVNSGPIEDSNITYAAQLSAVPGFSYLVNGSSSLQKEDAERYNSGVADDIIFSDDSSGNVFVETLGNSLSVLPHGYVGEQLHDYGRNDYVNPTFVSDSDTCHRTESSNFPSLSIPPSLFSDKKEESISSALDYEVSKSCTAETTTAVGGPLCFFDFGIDVSSSAVASAAAMKEAIDKAKVKMISARELMERKKDGLKGLKPGTGNEINGEGKVEIYSDDSTLRNHHQDKASKREQAQFKNHEEGVQDASTTSQLSLDSMLAEYVAIGEARYANGRFTKNHSPSLDHGLNVEDGELKEASQYYEFLINCNPKVEPDPIDNASQVANHRNSSDFGNASRNTTSLKNQKGNMEEMNFCAHENEDPKLDKEPRENRRRLRTTKATSRKDFHRKMLKVAQEVHETVLGDYMETENNIIVGSRGHGIELNFEIWPQGNNNEIRFDQAAHHVEKHKLEPDTCNSEFRLREDLVQVEYGKKETGRCQLEGKERICAGEETLECVKDGQEREENENGVKEAHDIIERIEARSWNDTELRKRMVFTVDEDVVLENKTPAHKEYGGLSESTTGQNSDVRHSYDEECLMTIDNSWERVGNEIKVQETQSLEHSENSIEEAAISHIFELKLEDSAELMEYENHESSTEDTEIGDPFHAFQNEDIQKLMQENKLWGSENIFNGAPQNKVRMPKDDVQAKLNSDAHDSFPGICLNVDFKYYPSSILYDKEKRVPYVPFECDDPISSDMASGYKEKDARTNAIECEAEKKYTEHSTQGLAVNVERGDFGCSTFIGKTDSKVSTMADLCTSTEQLQETETAQPKISERKESIQNRFQSSNISQKVVKEKYNNEYLSAEDREKADGPEKKHLRTFEEGREKEREKKVKEGVKEHDELRKKEQKREIERLKKLQGARDRDAVKELEKERLRKLEKEWERKREREKDRMGIDLKASEARERAFAEACEKAERATAETRHRTMAEARDRLEKACVEARENSEKASVEAGVRAERAAVDRATAEARERALEKARAERTVFGACVERSSSEKISTSVRDMEIQHCSSSSDLWDTNKCDGLDGESAQRYKARLERHRRTVERVEKALAEKNMRDLIAQREQAERNRLAEALDVEIKRWSSGKEGNMRALLSTLQYILGSDGGWQPIPLTEVITSASVKKAYRKATLYVHPDKLQQRGATIQKKYICEKVFDLLKDAWNKFNYEER